MYELMINHNTVSVISKLSDGIAQATFFYAHGYSVDLVSTVTGEIVFCGEPDELPIISSAVVFAL